MRVIFKTGVITQIAIVGIAIAYDDEPTQFIPLFVSNHPKHFALAVYKHEASVSNKSTLSLPSSLFSLAQAYAASPHATTFACFSIVHLDRDHDSFHCGCERENY